MKTKFEKISQKTHNDKIENYVIFDDGDFRFSKYLDKDLKPTRVLQEVRWVEEGSTLVSVAIYDIYRLESPGTFVISGDHAGLAVVNTGAGLMAEQYMIVGPAKDLMIGKAILYSNAVIKDLSKLDLPMVILRNLLHSVGFMDPMRTLNPVGSNHQTIVTHPNDDALMEVLSRDLGGSWDASLHISLGSDGELQVVYPEGVAYYWFRSGGSFIKVPLDPIVKDRLMALPIWTCRGSVSDDDGFITIGRLSWAPEGQEKAIDRNRLGKSIVEIAIESMGIISRVPISEEKARELIEIATTVAVDVVEGGEALYYLNKPDVGVSPLLFYFEGRWFLTVC